MPASSSSSSWTDVDSDSDEELAFEAKRALAYLQKHRNYRYIEFLAQGGFGWVALVHDDEKGRSLAVKCSNDISETEINCWPKLEHGNILPLLEYITLDNCTVFIMPAMRKDLLTMVDEKHFYKEELSFGLCRVWLRDVASALAYLHSRFLCHLDLKLDNVFIKEDGYACLGDFSLLADTRKIPPDCPFLEVYKPPEYNEWCREEGFKPSSKFTGDAADMWQYGILSIDLLTNLTLTGKKSSRSISFPEDVMPLLQNILKHGEYLSSLLNETFTGIVISDVDTALCHDFLTDILKLEPSSRMSADISRQHGFTNIAWPQLSTESVLPTRVNGKRFLKDKEAPPEKRVRRKQTPGAKTGLSWIFEKSSLISEDDEMDDNEATTTIATKTPGPDSGLSPESESSTSHEVEMVESEVTATVTKTHSGEEMDNSKATTTTATKALGLNSELPSKLESSILYEVEMVESEVTTTVTKTHSGDEMDNSKATTATATKTPGPNSGLPSKLEISSWDQVDMVKNEMAITVIKTPSGDEKNVKASTAKKVNVKKAEGIKFKFQ